MYRMGGGILRLKLLKINELGKPLVYLIYIVI